MHKVHAGYTLLVRLRADRIADAAAWLARPDPLPFERSTTTHFATVTIVPAQHYGDVELPATLLFATSFCGPADVHVAELVKLMGPQLCELFEHCEGFHRDDLEQFIKENRHSDVFYSGMQNLSPGDVTDHNALRAEIEDFIDRQQALGGLATSAVGVRTQIQVHIRSHPSFAWAQQPFAPPRAAWLALHWRWLILLGVAVPAAAALVVSTLGALFSVSLRTVAVDGWIGVVVLAAVAYGLFRTIRHEEDEQTYVTSRQPDGAVRDLAATQNRPVINEMTIAGVIKEGRVRPLVLRLALWVVERAVEGFPKLRTPLTIPTVATARWIAADGGRRLIFISNYTNAAEGYVRDFIDTESGAENINLSFGFGRGYPKTRAILKEGAITNPNAFGYVVTANQQRTAFWYGRYTDISIDNITINRKIREGLFGPMNETEAQTWLHLL
jgi:hypothetical protein